MVGTAEQRRDGAAGRPGWGRDRSGATAVEFALIGPMLLMILFGIIQFGLTMNNFLELSAGDGLGARLFAVSRSSTTPLTSTTAEIAAAAPGLTAASITVTASVNGTACATDSACATALAAAAGGTASVTATYPCNLTVMGVNYAPTCNLNATMTELIE